MELNKVIKLLEGLEEGTGLFEEENWDDSIETQQWRLASIVAINTAIDILKSGKVVGTLDLNGKKYKITE